MSAMNEKDYYKILGVDENATTEEIRKAFQQKARKLHPDVNKAPDAEERFKEVSEAYAVLSDDQKRKRYDAMRSGSFAGYSGTPGGSYGGGQGDPFGSPFGWGFPFSGTGHRRTASRRSRAYNPKAGANIAYQLDLDDESARKGTKRGITYERYVTCDACHGMGSVESGHAETCPTCGGTGHISVDLGSIFGFGVMEMECPECEGAGKVVAHPCEVCGGSGRVLSASEVVVEVPAGSHDGDTVKIPGMGNAGTNGSSAGDFVCRIGVPSERLTQSQAFAFQLFGFVTPFAIFGAMAGVLGAVLPFVVVMAVVALIALLRDGVGGNRTWWKNALASFGNGLTSGLLLAFLMTMMFSCGTAQYAAYDGGAGVGASGLSG